MVVVAQGVLPAPGKQYKVYLNEDRAKKKWYLRVTHTYPENNQHFRAGTYDTKDDALDALQTLDPIYPKKGRSKRGTVDQYANGMWRVRVKHRGEHMHVGYFKNRKEAEKRLKEALSDHKYLEERYENLLAKRKRKREMQPKNNFEQPQSKRQRRGRNKEQHHRARVDPRPVAIKQRKRRVNPQRRVNPTLVYQSNVNHRMNSFYQQHSFVQQASLAYQKQAVRQQYTAWPGQLQLYGPKISTPILEEEEKLEWCEDVILEMTAEPIQIKTESYSVQPYNLGFVL